MSSVIESITDLHVNYDGLRLGQRGDLKRWKTRKENLDVGDWCQCDECCSGLQVGSGIVDLKCLLFFHNLPDHSPLILKNLIFHHGDRQN